MYLFRKEKKGVQIAKTKNDYLLLYLRIPSEA
jgi:hypothetical protein